MEESYATPVLSSTTPTPPITTTLANDVLKDSNNNNDDDEDEKEIEENSLIWYFAFGSNMNPKVFGPEGRTVRRVTPRAIQIGCVPGWRFICNLRSIPILEPGMGNLIPLDYSATNDTMIGKEMGKDHPCVHGVAYLLSKEEFDQIYLSEGGNDGSYRIQELSMIPYSTMEGDGTQQQQTTLRVHACYCPPDDTKRCKDGLDLPSKRYLTLLMDGAKYWKLDPAYCDYLSQYPHAKPHYIVKYSFAGLVVIPLLSPGIFAMISIKTLERAGCGSWLSKSCQPIIFKFWFVPVMELLWNVFERKLICVVPLLLVAIAGLYAMFSPPLPGIISSIKD